MAKHVVGRVAKIPPGGRKIVELDARPSDCIAIAVRSGSPIFVVKELWEQLDDMSSVLQDMKDKGLDLGG